MRWVSAITLVIVYVCWLRPSGAHAADEVGGNEARPRVALAVWDTRKAAADVLTPSALTEKTDWTSIPTQKTVASFEGDAVMTNGRLLAVLRKHGAAVEVYGVTTDGPVLRARLRLLAPSGEPAANLERSALVENSKTAASLEAVYRTEKGAAVTARFRLPRDEVYVRTDPGSGASHLRVECPARFVVLPDFFADDILIDARAIPPHTIELPSENFLLHLTGQQDAIAMCVFENRQQDVKVHLEGSGEQRTIAASEIAFENKKVWLALLDGPRMWHAREIKTDDTGKVLPLAWTMPFPAHWRVDFTRTNGLTDSWEMLLQDEKGGRFRKPSWLGSEEDTLGPNRHRWNTVLGSYPYPCWADANRTGFVQPLKNRALAFQGPAVIYPINRVQQTPLDAYTTLDIMRSTLGVGPCQYILDLENQKSEYRGRATCSVRDKLGEIYGNKQQKQQRAEVDKTLDEGLTFVKHIRGRIARYIEFGHRMRDYLAEQKKTHPEQSEFLTEMEKIVAEIDARVARRKDKIKTPEHVAAMNAEFRKTVLDDDGPDALAHCKEYTHALVEIGDNQDELSGECRWVVKAIRQKAGMLMAMDPKAAPLAMEIRKRTQETLRNPASHEGAHH